MSAALTALNSDPVEEWDFSDFFLGGCLRTPKGLQRVRKFFRSSSYNPLINGL